MFKEVPKNCRYGYGRVSSKSQEDNSSLESQKQEFIQQDHPFYLSKSLIIYKNTYELQIKFQILQNFSVDDLEKKLHVPKLLMRFNASQKIQADNKKEIIRQFNQLPIQEEYKLVLKNGQTTIIDKNHR